LGGGIGWWKVVLVGNANEVKVGGEGWSKKAATLINSVGGDQNKKEGLVREGGRIN